MSEDKIMDIIKGKLLMIDKMLKQDQEEGHGSAYEMQNEDFEAIQGLLDLYQKEKEKDRRIKDELKKIVDLYDNILQCTRKYNDELANILCDLQELLEERN